MRSGAPESMSHQDQRCRMRSAGESIGEGECSDGKFEEARRSVNSGAEFSFWESPEMAYAEVRAMPRGAPQGVLRDRLVGVGA